MLQPLDGPASQTTLTVTSASVAEVKVGGSALVERKVVTLYPDEKIYIYFGDGISTPTVSNLQNDGIQLAKRQLVTLEAADTQFLYTLAVSTTSNVKVVERA